MKTKMKEIGMVKELLIRKKKLEDEIGLIKQEIDKLIKSIPPGTYDDVIIVENKVLRLDTNRLKEEEPMIYYKYLKETVFKYAKLKTERRKHDKRKANKSEM